MSRVIWGVIVGLFALIGIAAPIKIANKHTGSGSSSGKNSSSASTVTVHMAGLKFAPSALVAKKGATVVFNNDDVAPHTATEDTAGGVDSGVISPGKVFHLVIDRRLVYHCAIHPFMKATINLAG